MNLFECYDLAQTSYHFGMAVLCLVCLADLLYITYLLWQVRKESHAKTCQVCNALQEVVKNCKAPDPNPLGRAYHPACDQVRIPSKYEK